MRPADLPTRRSPRRAVGAAIRRARRAARRVWLRGRGVLARLDPGLRRRDIRRSSPERFVRTAYPIMLRRAADPDGVRNYVEHLEQSRLTPDGVLDEMLTSMELREVPFVNPLRALHQSRCDFVRMLPRGARILDLGGTDQEHPEGALVSMGYPYRFDELVIVDLPHDDRHEIYARSERADTVTTALGPVRYEYHSMVDLDRYANDAFDLVVSGESIEHISEAGADVMLQGVLRILRPGGWFCLDTPNRRATVVHVGADRLTNPDHELEYTHDQLAAKLERTGFDVVDAFGLSYVGDSIRSGVFSEAEFARNHGVFHAIDECYLLAYFCRKPA